MQQHTRCYATRMPNTITNQSTVLHRAFAFAPQQQKRAHRPHKFSSVVVRASAAADPEDARGAIALGLKLFESGDYESALQLFDKSLGLPGTGMVCKDACCRVLACAPGCATLRCLPTGIKRFRDKPPMISDGEKQAAYFNIACCQSKLGNIKDGLIAVAGCIEAGYVGVCLVCFLNRQGCVGDCCGGNCCGCNGKQAHCVALSFVAWCTHQLCRRFGVCVAKCCVDKCWPQLVCITIVRTITCCVTQVYRLSTAAHRSRLGGAAQGSQV